MHRENEAKAQRSDAVDGSVLPWYADGFTLDNERPSACQRKSWKRSSPRKPAQGLDGLGTPQRRRHSRLDL